MAKDTLSVDISPVLLEAMGLPPNGPVDYFTLLGVYRSPEGAEEIDQILMERSRELRRWQTSPQYGDEVVKLLKLLQRVGKILSDPPRRKAYLSELERMERGETASNLELFEDMVRAALADNRMDVHIRKELNQFASDHAITQADAQRILQHVRQELDAIQRTQAQAQKAAGGWEFKLAGEGEEAFTIMLDGLEAGGEFNDETPARMLAQVGRYGLDRDRAARLLAEFQKTRFRRMVDRVASGGVVHENQIRILLPKAAAYGLNHDEAYEIISDFTLSHKTPEDILSSYAKAVDFSQEEIHKMIE